MKKAKKIMVILLTMLMVIASTCISAYADTVNIGTWSVNIVVDGVTHKVTSEDVAKLTPYTVTAGYTKNGTATSNSYTGARLKDVLKSIGVTDVTTVSATGSDGYTMKTPYDKATAMNNNTLLAWGIDGKAMDATHGPVMMIPGGSGTTSSQFARLVATITVTGATLAANPSTPTSTPATTTPAASNPKTGSSSPVPTEVMLFAAVCILAATTTIGLKKSFSNK